MKQFKITYRNPFEQASKNITFFNQEETINSFLAIDWAKLNLKCAANQHEVVHHFYFFDIAAMEENVTKSNLTIAGTYTYGNQLEQLGPLFDVIYERQTQIETRGFFGLGAPRTKTVSVTTHLPDCDQKYATTCIAAFLNDELEFLEKELNHSMI